MRLKIFSPLIIVLSLCILFYSCGEDRSGEQPFAPTVETLSIQVVADSALLTGHVVASPNSSLTACGFEYGNDSINSTVSAEEPTETFTVATDSLGIGTYYAVAYATNGMGTSRSDTTYFTIGE